MGVSKGREKKVVGEDDLEGGIVMRPMIAKIKEVKRDGGANLLIPPLLKVDERANKGGKISGGWCVESKR